MKRLFSRNTILIVLVFCLSLSLRLYGLNWDQGQHLHPDERYLTMVVNDIRLPDSVYDYFSNSTSPLNPYNYPQYSAFVYGTFPVFLTKLFSVLLKMDNYDHIQLVGRALSAIFDSFNIFLIYLIARKLTLNRRYTIIPSVFYAITILPIQLSHFFTVDTFLNTFLLSTFTLLVYDLFPLAAVTFGLALACKISAVFFVPVIFLFSIKKAFDTKKYFQIFTTLLFSALLMYLTVRVFQPYSFTGLFKLDSQFLTDLKTFKMYASREGNYPPSVQWLSKTPIIFPLQNLIIFGLGLPISLLFVYTLSKKISLPKLNLKFIILFWISFLFVVQGVQFAHTMRYFLPIYPFIILYTFSQPIPRLKYFLAVQILICLAFINIYSVTHSRNQASTWIYQNIPPGSTITNEYWDDPLPMYQPGSDPSVYTGIMISPYDPDSPEKWSRLDSHLASANYLIMSSNRLWGSIPLVPDRYPQTTIFYQQLFNQQLPFKKVVEINSYPGFRMPFLSHCLYLGPTNYPGGRNSWFSMGDYCTYPGIYFRDDVAEEAFTVYDHPKVLIYQHIN